MSVSRTGSRRGLPRQRIGNPSRCGRRALLPVLQAFFMRSAVCFAAMLAYAGHFAAWRAAATIMAGAAPARRFPRVFSAGFPPCSLRSSRATKAVAD
jgi:hypothetical protein